MSRFRFVHDHRSDYPVKRLCQLVEVSRSGYYDWAERPLSDHDLDDWTLSEMTRLSEVYTHAAECSAAVVTMLEPPHDEERASMADVVPLTSG